MTAVLPYVTSTNPSPPMPLCTCRHQFHNHLHDRCAYTAVCGCNRYQPLVTAAKR